MASQPLLNQYLNEALATERALVTTLTAHIAMTPDGDYRRLLQRHLGETRRQAAALSDHVEEQPGSVIGDAIGLAETIVGQALTLAKGPLDLLRGHGRQEKLLKNAKDECATEALEIATYDAIEAVARELGQDEVAELAVAHRAEEERMLADLRALIPVLAGATVADRTDEDDEAEDEDDAPAVLPIEGYDGLNAGQVVARMSALTQSELSAVLAYERANRNRRAIVERGEQLTSDEPWPGYDDADESAVLAGLTPETAGAVREYESRHQRRVAVLEAATAAS
jgi:ferritin-like metal-binding protein YciE